jgi:hypothetical protein
MVDNLRVCLMFIIVISRTVYRMFLDLRYTGSKVDTLAKSKIRSKETDMNF